MSHKISIIIPTYNERGTIAPLVNRITNTIQESTASDTELEIIIVDDNSPDGTGEIYQSLSNQDPAIRVIIRTDKRSLASAVKLGIMESEGDIIVIMDADSSHNPTLIPALVVPITDGKADIVVASRFVEGGKMVSDLRHIWGSKLLNAFTRTLLRIPIKDVTGGFLCLRKDILKNLDLDAIFRGHGDYCFVLLHDLCNQGWHTQEIPFTYHNRETGFSKTKFFRAGFSYGARALRIRLGLGR